MFLQVSRRLTRRVWRSMVAAAQGEDPEAAIDLLSPALNVRRTPVRLGGGQKYSMRNGRVVRGGK